MIVAGLENMTVLGVCSAAGVVLESSLRERTCSIRGVEIKH